MLLSPSSLSLPPLPVAANPAQHGIAAAIADGSTENSFRTELMGQLPPLPGVLQPGNSGALPGPGPAAGRELSQAEETKIHATAEQLESLMLYQILKQMWNSIPESKVLPDGNAGKMFREMWLEQVAGEAGVAGGGIGLARTVEAQLLDRARRSFTPEQAAAEAAYRTAAATAG